MKLLSHLKIKENLDSDYEEQQFVIIRDSLNGCFFILELNSSAVRSLLRTFLSLCGFIVFGLYILQNPGGKSRNSIQVL